LYTVIGVGLAAAAPAMRGRVVSAAPLSAVAAARAIQARRVSGLSFNMLIS
jgi:hypothetical protein